MCREDEFDWAESLETYKKKDHSKLTGMVKQEHLPHSGEKLHLNNNLNYILPLKQHKFKGM